jgi:predicted ester cyclase
MSDQRALIVRWFDEVWNQGKRETIDELMPEDCVIHDGDTDATGPAAFKLFFDRLRSAFSDIRVTAHEAISQGDFECLRWSATMRHTGDLLGIGPTDKELHTSGISMARIKGGRFVEAWQNWDMLGLIQQITNAAVHGELYMGQRANVEKPPRGHCRAFLRE